MFKSGFFSVESAKRRPIYTKLLFFVVIFVPPSLCSCVFVSLFQLSRQCERVLLPPGGHTNFLKMVGNKEWLFSWGSEQRESILFCRSGRSIGDGETVAQLFDYHQYMIIHSTNPCFCPSTPALAGPFNPNLSYSFHGTFWGVRAFRPMSSSKNYFQVYNHLDSEIAEKNFAQSHPHMWR